MFNKKFVLIPLFLLLAAGSLQAASVPASGYWQSVDGSWFEGYKNVFVTGSDHSILEWYNSANHKSSLDYDSVEFDPYAGSVTIGTLLFYYDNKSGNFNFDAVLNLYGLDDTIPIKFKIFNNGSQFSAEIPSDEVYTFSISGHNFTLTDLALTQDAAKAGRYNLTGTVSSVPLPATAWLLGSGLLGLMGLRRRS